MKAGQKIDVYLKGTNRLVRGCPCFFCRSNQAGTVRAMDSFGCVRLFKLEDFDITPHKGNK